MPRQIAPRPSVLPASVAVLLLLLLCGCQTPGTFCADRSRVSQIGIVSAIDSNQGTALAVDVVYVTDKLALAALSSLTADAYFQNKGKLAREFGPGMSVHAFALPPGVVITTAPTKPPCNLAGMLVFANYASPGSHRLMLNPRWSGTVLLERDGPVWSAKP